MGLGLAVIVIHLAVLGHSVADQILTPQTGGSTFGRGFREPKYDIEFHSEDSPFQPDDDQESLVMPGVIMETEKQVKLKTPDELLEVLSDRCFLRQEGWWSYEFCYNKKIRQFHQEDEKVVQEYILGYHDPEATLAYNENLSDISTLKDPRSKDASQRYHAHQYTNGTTCDLTNQPRETEVRFVCSEPRVMISSITELSTCRYALTVQCPMLCKHPVYQEERPVWHTINCNLLPKNQKEKGTDDGKIKDARIIVVSDTENENLSSGDEVET
ncbi:hypothetical protein MLD38_014967 [Melastoma candidum]|uniref:Uncharacterized protein n=1 Tax=Melastoma candidum TaxID=119954 RepID=A0ACB9RN01_9MYRT|nr:hypothetical protein MLD38_014967 [Melastoma candidum]